MDISSFDFEKLLSHIIPGVILYIPLDNVLIFWGYPVRDNIAIFMLFLLGVVIIIIFDGIRHMLVDSRLYVYFFNNINRKFNNKKELLNEESFAKYQNNNYELFKDNVKETYRYYEFYSNLIVCIVLYFIIVNLTIYSAIMLGLFGVTLLCLSYIAFEAYLIEINRVIKYCDIKSGQ